MGNLNDAGKREVELGPPLAGTRLGRRPHHHSLGHAGVDADPRCMCDLPRLAASSRYIAGMVFRKATGRPELQCGARRMVESAGKSTRFLIKVKSNPPETLIGHAVILPIHQAKWDNRAE